MHPVVRLVNGVWALYQCAQVHLCKDSTDVYHKDDQQHHLQPYMSLLDAEVRVQVCGETLLPTPLT